MGIPGARHPVIGGGIAIGIPLDFGADPGTALTYATCGNRGGNWFTAKTLLGITSASSVDDQITLPGAGTGVLESTSMHDFTILRGLE